jgi:hypothetical protein
MVGEGSPRVRVSYPTLSEMAAGGQSRVRH